MPELAVKECTSVEDMLEVWDALLSGYDVAPVVTLMCQSWPSKSAPRLKTCWKYGMHCCKGMTLHNGHGNVPELAVKEHASVEDMLEVWDIQP